MRERDIGIPTFYDHQVNKGEGGTIISSNEILVMNVKASVEALVDTLPVGNTVTIAIKELQADGSYKIGIIGFGYDDEELINIDASGFSKLPGILLSGKTGALNTVKRILKSIAFW